MTIAIVPAAGHAERILGLPKFMLPIGDTTLFAAMCQRITVREPMLFIGTNSDSTSQIRRNAPKKAIVYVVHSETMTETVLAVRDIAGTESVLFGMPDTYWCEDDVFQRLENELYNGADVAVAVWPVRDNQRRQGGQVWFEYYDIERHITQVVDKNPNCPYPFIWGALAWKPAFWPYLDAAMPHVGYGLQPAIDAGLDVRAVVMDGDYYDCGTSERYFEMIRATTGEKA